MKTTVNTRILLLKDELKLSTMEFCAKAKISTGTFQNIRVGENINQKTLNLIVENLNVNSTWLKEGKGEMFLPAKEGNNENPWKDALVSQIKEENNTLKKEVERLWQMVSHYTGGTTPNFLKAIDKAGQLVEMYSFPNKPINSVGVRAQA